jgi:multicomponent Na+:H+ antiporter subunit E
MKLKRLNNITRVLITFAFLMGLWLLFTFSLDPFSLLLGGIFSFLISLLTYDLFVEKDERIQKGILPRFELLIFYVFILVWEIYIASFNVVYCVITMKINPGLVRIKTRLRSRFAQALLANSITLTPGTVTVDLDKNELLVHWLFVGAKDGTKAAQKIKGNYEKQLGRIFY